MSWGERSCVYSRGGCPVPGGPTMAGCNVDCPCYKADGVTPPNSTSREERKLMSRIQHGALRRAFIGQPAPLTVQRRSLPPELLLRVRKERERR